MLTDRNLVWEREHPVACVGGIQRVYRFANGNGLSFVNGQMLHISPFAWEAAVLQGVSEDGKVFDLTYDTPLTDDVEIFDSDEEANAFIERARVHFEGKSNADPD